MRKTLGSILGLFSALIILSACASAPATSQASAPGGVLSTSNPAAQPTSQDPATAIPNTGSGTQGAVSRPVTAVSPSNGDLTVFTIVQASSRASYKVREQLANLSFPTDAVGTTPDISGTIAIHPDGSIDQTQSKIVVNLSNLASDRSMRDHFVDRNILHTDQYPEVTFIPTQISGLPQSLPTSGTISFKLTGNLTILDVTKPATWDVTMNVQGGQATGTATTSFKFEDFNLSQPSVPVVLSLVDNITLEADITIQKK